MCGKLNDVLASYDAPFRLDFDLIEKTLTKGSIRERHLAKALRIAAYAHFNNDKAAIAKFFETIFGGKALKSNVDDLAAVENEIRGNLLKAAERLSSRKTRKHSCRWTRYARSSWPPGASRPTRSWRTMRRADSPTSNRTS